MLKYDDVVLPLYDSQGDKADKSQNRKNVESAIKSYKNIEKEDRKEIEDMFKLFFESAIKTIKDKRKEVKI